MRIKPRYYHVSDTFTDIAVGLSDGLTIPFIVIAGMAGAQASVHTIIIGGFIAAIIGAIAMGFSAYAGEKEQLHETGELQPREEEILRRIGVDEDIKQQLAADAAKERSEFDELAASYQLKESNARTQMFKSAFLVGVAYFIGGLVTVLPFLIFENISTAFIASATLVVALIIILGYVRAKRTEKNMAENILRPLLLTIGAAFGVYYVAGLFV